MSVVPVGVPGSDIGNRLGITDKAMVTISQRVEFTLSSKKSGQENGHIVGFTAAVAQNYLIVFGAQFIAECFGVFSLPLGQIDGSGMHQFVDLIRNKFGDTGMSVSNRDSGDTGDEVKVTVSLVVVKVLVLALYDEDRLFVEVEVDAGRHVLVSESFDLLVGGAGVGSGLEVKGRQGEFDVPHGCLIIYSRYFKLSIKIVYIHVT